MPFMIEYRNIYGLTAIQGVDVVEDNPFFFFFFFFFRGDLRGIEVREYSEFCRHQNDVCFEAD